MKALKAASPESTRWSWWQPGLQSSGRQREPHDRQGPFPSVSPAEQARGSWGRGVGYLPGPTLGDTGGRPARRRTGAAQPRAGSGNADGDAEHAPSRPR